MTDFDRLWDERLAPVLESVKAERDHLVKRRTRLSLLGLAAGAIAGLLVGLIEREWHVTLTVLAGVAVGYTVGWLYANRPMRALGAALKTRANTATAESFGLGYFAEVGRPPDYQRFQDLGLLPAGTYQAKVEDWFAGASKSGEFDFFELRLFAESKGVTLSCFHGILIRLPLARRIEGTTVVSRDQGDLGNAVEATLHRTMSGRLERVRLVDSEFESRFEVYGDDQVAARYMLTPNVMEGVKRIERRFRDECLRFALDGGRGETGAVLVTLETGDLFDADDAEIDLFDREHHRRVHAEIEAIVDLVELFQKELDPVEAFARSGSEIE